MEKRKKTLLWVLIGSIIFLLVAILINAKNISFFSNASPKSGSQEETTQIGNEKVIKVPIPVKVNQNQNQK